MSRPNLLRGPTVAPLALQIAATMTDGKSTSNPISPKSGSSNLSASSLHAAPQIPVNPSNSSTLQVEVSRPSSRSVNSSNSSNSILWFRALDYFNSSVISIRQFNDFMTCNGILPGDQRLKPFYRQIQSLKPSTMRNGPSTEPEVLNLHEWNSILSNCPPLTFKLIQKSCRGELIIPEWPSFATRMKECFYRISEQISPTSGKVATYIPELAFAKPDWFGMTFVSVDGQTLHLGDVDVEFSIQSSSKPVSYLLALEEHGDELVHNYVGMEPSGRGFNEMVLNDDGIPHNPYINSGAIMICSLLQAEKDQSSRFRYIMEQYQRVTGYNKSVTFSNSTYLSERATADRNFALGFLMQDEGAFQYGSKASDRVLQKMRQGFQGRKWDPSSLEKNLELYFQCCSITTSTSGQGIIASTLASGGVCPFTEERVFQSDNVKHVLALMLSCGMYDYSGEWSWSVGVPGKSGVSGCIMLVIPGVGGLSIYSPPLDVIGNSVRGIALSKSLVENFAFHYYDQMNGMISSNSAKLNPLDPGGLGALEMFCNLCFSVTRGDLQGIATILNSGRISVNDCDYDQRTPLHIAASEGKLPAVKYLCSKGGDPTMRDRWNNTPLDDAIREGHVAVQKYLRAILDGQITPQDHVNSSLG
jgi:glutaminase